MIEYIDKIIIQHVDSKRKELGLPCNFPALVLFDHFSGQTSQAIINKLDLMHVLIPRTCTDRLQPMDLSVKWYASQIQKQIQQSPSSSLTPVDIRLSTIKSVHAKWLIEAYDYIKSQPEIIINGFKAAGILEKIES